MSLDDGRDPTDFEGVLPVIPPGSPAPVFKDSTSNAATGASAAGVRAFTAQAVAFYFRAPVKAFFRTRVDYLVSPALQRDLSILCWARNDRAADFAQAYAKSINPDVQAGRFSWRSTTPGLLAHAIRHYGWRFIPEHLLPPLAANVVVGAALYTSYLQILARLHEPAAHATKTVWPPAPPAATFAAGFAAGGIQSVLAAPLDALQVRYEQQQQRGKASSKTMVAYGKHKLREIGLRGIFAGWGISFLKDSFGSGIFFATFEYVKAQGYYNFVRWYYGAMADPADVDKLALKSGGSVAEENTHSKTVIRPHYALEPAFLMLAGVTASLAQQTVLYPLSTFQTLHYERLEELDEKAAQLRKQPTSTTSASPASSSQGKMLRAYYHAYQETWKQAFAQAHARAVEDRRRGGGTLRQMHRWFFRGFWWFTIRQVPSTSAALIIFELVRRKYGLAGEPVKITQDGYDILLA
jgi:hypothetical protein